MVNDAIAGHRPGAQTGRRGDGCCAWERPAGRFSFTGLSAQQYNYTITADGFGQATGTIDLTSGSVTQNIYLSRSRALTGTVLTPVRMGAYINPPPPPQPVNPLPAPQPASD